MLLQRCGHLAADIAELREHQVFFRRCDAPVTWPWVSGALHVAHRVHSEPLPFAPRLFEKRRHQVQLAVDGGWFDLLQALVAPLRDLVGHDPADALAGPFQVAEDGEAQFLPALALLLRRHFLLIALDRIEQRLVVRGR